MATGSSSARAGRPPPIASSAGRGWSRDAILVRVARVAVLDRGGRWRRRRCGTRPAALPRRRRVVLGLARAAGRDGAVPRLRTLARSERLQLGGRRPAIALDRGRARARGVDPRVSLDLRWTAQATLGLLLGAAIAGAAYAAGVFAGAQDLRDMKGALI